MTDKGFGNITMCPICDKYCDFWKLSDSCFNSKIAYLFDNAATVLWSIFMTVWGKIMNSKIDRYMLFYSLLDVCVPLQGVKMKLSSFCNHYTGTIYFELWRRQQEILKWEWDLQDEDDLDEARPEFEKDVKTKRYDLCSSILSGISKI